MNQVSTELKKRLLKLTLATTIIWGCLEVISYFASNNYFIS